MDKNGKVQVIPLSKDYIKGYEGIRWDDRPGNGVVIYDPFIDGPIEELLPKPVAMKHEGGGQPIPAVAFSTTWDCGASSSSPDSFTGE